MQITKALLERIKASGGHASPAEVLALAFEVEKLTTKIDDVPIAELERCFGFAADATKNKADDTRVVENWLYEW
jgi:hypothetical protein